jgi:hypothetical protein
MHEAYLERVGQWVKAAPAHEWGKDYAKENYSRAYMCGRHAGRGEDDLPANQTRPD